MYYYIEEIKLKEKNNKKNWSFRKALKGIKKAYLAEGL